MKFAESVTTCLTKKYANFSGRAVRSEYWWFMLVPICINTLLSILFAILGGAETIEMIVSLLVAAGFFFPVLAVTARRLHDIGRSGWWFLLIFTGIGSLLLIYWYLQPSATGANKYGEQP